MQTNVAISAVICAMFVVTCYGNSGARIRFTSLRNADVESFDLALPEGVATYMRVKRGTMTKMPKVVSSGAAIMRGEFATNLILKGAKPVLLSPLRQVYSKPGGYSAAINDFHSLDPTSSRMVVLKDQVMAIGRVGDRIIHLMADKVSKNGKITITRKKSRSQSWKVEVEYPKGEEKGKKNGKGKQIKKGWWWNNN